MSTEQVRFFFDAPLVDIPASLIPPKRKPTPVTVDAAELVELIKQWLDAFDGEYVTAEEAWKGIGFDPLSCVGWHSARLLDAMLVSGWQGCNAARKPGDPPMQFRRAPAKPEVTACPGFEESGCGRDALDGGLCEICLEVEREDLWNSEG
jgi:hypothetical protein